MKQVKNCKKCHMVFSADENVVLCKRCQHEEDEIFRPIREYLYQHPGTSIHELSTEFNINISRIGEYFRDGRPESAR